MASNFKETMNLPQTDFPMRASLTTREPERLEKWNEVDLYHQVLKMHEGEPSFILHDGPPYANGHIHCGTAYNKIFKDIIVKYHAMTGHFAPYVPGWDCHGQPIEHMVEKKLGPEKMAKIDQVTLRRLCRDWATEFIDVQRNEFKRLGVQGEWEDPYLTYTPEYEAGNVEIFKKMYEAGAIYRGRKPIHWCIRCHTALAEAEIEYADEVSDSIYVKFAFTEAPAAFATEGKPVKLVIWTTTPWTLPANVAVTLAPNADYIAIKHDDELLVMAEALVDQVAHAAGWDVETIERVRDANGEVVRVKGRDLDGLTYNLPIFPEKTGVVINGDHVELTTGTGAVHTAPGHGEDDYLVGQRYKLPTVMPVLDDGTFDAGGGPFEGLSVWEANPVIIEWLRDNGMLLAADKINHSYPHCWRCKQPVIFRATDQWFVSMEDTDLRERAMKGISEVNWMPERAITRISAMVKDRPDWCISRQRAWGVPVPVFKCAECGETVATPGTFDAVIELFRTEGADAWFSKAPSEYLPAGTHCEACGHTEVLPETDILDVWWESGVSHTSVLRARPYLSAPADIYSEGSDQHRGWFQSSLLTSVGSYGVPPYKGVITHGFVVDGEGRKMSKSLGNTINPIDLVNKYGADVLRLWVMASDYAADIAVSEEIMDRTSETYRRIRNTFRFLLGNISDFDPATDAVAWADMEELDKVALTQAHDMLAKVSELYEGYRYHQVYRTIYDYVNDLSSIYMDVLKDRLYSDGPEWRSRRSAQTVLATVLNVLVRVLAPVLSFTCDEVWEYMPAALTDGVKNVALASWPTIEVNEGEAAQLRETYDIVFTVRDVVTKALEDARNADVVKKSQEAVITIAAPQEVVDALWSCGGGILAELFIVADVRCEAADETEVLVEVSVAEGEKCPRCWNIRELGVDPAHPDVCERCAKVLTELEG